MGKWIRYCDYTIDKLVKIEGEKINKNVDQLNIDEIIDELGLLTFVMTSCLENEDMNSLEKYMRRYDSIIGISKSVITGNIDLKYFDLYFSFIDAFLYFSNNMFTQAKKEYVVLEEKCLDCFKEIKNSSYTNFEKMLFVQSLLNIYESADVFYGNMGMMSEKSIICNRQKELLRYYYSIFDENILNKNNELNNVMLYIKFSGMDNLLKDYSEIKNDLTHTLDICNKTYSHTKEKIWKLIAIWCESCFFKYSGIYSDTNGNNIISKLKDKEFELTSLKICEQGLYYSIIGNVYSGKILNELNSADYKLQQETIDNYDKAYRLFCALSEKTELDFECQIARKVVKIFYSVYVSGLNILGAMYTENSMFEDAKKVLLDELKLLNDNRYANIMAEKKDLLMANANTLLCVILCVEENISRAEFYGKSCLDIVSNNEKMKNNAFAYEFAEKCCFMISDYYLKIKSKSIAGEWAVRGLDFIDLQKKNNCTTDNTDKFYNILLELQKKANKKSLFGR